ncbi:MAG: diguanylate cyclase domain-containing protein [Angustibacter sp.]
MDDERRALDEAYRLLEGVQGDAPDVALEAATRARHQARTRGWTHVELLLDLVGCVHGLVHGPSEQTHAVLDELLIGARTARAAALEAAGLGVRAVLAATRGDTAAVLADSAEAVRLLDDAGQPASERSTAYVVVAAAYNSLRLWELVDDLYLRADRCERSDPGGAQRAALAVDRVIVRVEWALALSEVGREEESREQLQRAAAAAAAARTIAMPDLWRHVADAGSEIVAVLEARDPLRHEQTVSALARTLRSMGDVELLPLLEASWALSLHRAGHRRRARAAARALQLDTSTSSGGSTIPSWVRALVLRGRRPSRALRAQAEHIDRLAVTRWDARLAMLDAARAQIDVARRRAERERLLREATTDALTGLRNRRVFDTWLGAGDLARPTDGLLLIDLDEFKEVNDRLGHSVGDEVLRIFGALVQEVLHDGDVGVRLGGDEFAVLVADCTDDPTLVRRETALRELVAAYDWPTLLAGRRLEVSTGAGVGSDDDTMSRTDLYRFADDDLYATKRGRTPSAR